MITAVLILLIISIQKTSSFPTFLEQAAIEPMKDYLSKGVSVLNLVNMEIVDEIANNMDKFPLMKETNATEQFKRIVYPNLKFPEKVEDLLEHNIDDITNTLKTYQNSMIDAISKNSKGATSDNGNVDATNENDSTADDNKGSKRTQRNDGDTKTDDTKSADNPQPKNGKNQEASDKKAENVKT